MYPTKLAEPLNLARVAKLEHPNRKVKMVIDTDTFNEIDDQFAITYALLSKDKMDVTALYAAPFYNDNSNGPEDGMERSYLELEKLLSHLDVPSQGLIFRGSTRYLPDAKTPVESEAARDLVAKALAASPDDPLYVVAIAAPTNVASAILMEPKIIDNIVVVWLGGHALHWQNAFEFNLYQDIHASRVLLDCGVPFVLIPCMGVTSHLITSLAEVREALGGYGAIGDYLVETFENCRPDHFGASRVIWDISAIAYFVNPEWVPTSLIPSPILTDGFTWSVDPARHPIKIANYIHRDDVFRDMFTKIRNASK